jgi:hypothetical protein
MWELITTNWINIYLHILLWIDWLIDLLADTSVPTDSFSHEDGLIRPLL